MVPALRIYNIVFSNFPQKKWNYLKFMSCVTMKKLFHYSLHHRYEKRIKKIHISEVWWRLHGITVHQEPGTKSLLFIVLSSFLLFQRSTSIALI